MYITLTHLDIFTILFNSVKYESILYSFFAELFYLWL